MYAFAKHRIQFDDFCLEIHCLRQLVMLVYTMFYLNFLVNVPAGSVGLSGGVLPWLCFFGALLNGCNFLCGRGDG